MGRAAAASNNQFDSVDLTSNEQVNIHLSIGGVQYPTKTIIRKNKSFRYLCKN